MIVSMHNRSCADFLVDTLSYRVRWITRCDLMEYAVKAGFSPSKVDSSLKRCWKAGLLRRLVYNSTIGSIQEPLLIGRSNELMARIPSMLASRHNELAFKAVLLEMPKQ